MRSTSALLLTLLALAPAVALAHHGWSGYEDVNAGGPRLIDHGVRVATHRLPLAVGHNHRRAGEGDQVLGHSALSLEFDDGREVCVRPNDSALGGHVHEPYTERPTQCR